MGNNIKIKLTDEQTNFLTSLPETGMGYQVVNVVLKNGEILHKRLVFNSMFLQLNDGENINPNDIVNIKLSE